MSNVEVQKFVKEALEEAEIMKNPMKKFEVVKK